MHTAVAAQEAGIGVVLIDTDPQKSATVWAEAREEEAPVVATADVSELQRVLNAARNEGMGLAIIDAAPHAAPAAASIARAADLIAIPCRPTAFDLAAVEGAVRIVRAAGVKAVFVLSACPFRAPEIVETRSALSSYGLPVAPVEITERRAFARAVAPLRSSRRMARQPAKYAPCGRGYRSRWHDDEADRFSGLHSQPWCGNLTNRGTTL